MALLAFPQWRHKTAPEFSPFPFNFQKSPQLRQLIGSHFEIS